MQKSIKYMALGLVFIGIILAWLAFGLSNSRTETSSQSVTKAAEPSKPSAPQAIVAKHALQAGQLLTPSDIELREVAQIATDAITDAGGIVGRGLAHAVAEGQVITQTSLLSGIAGMLQPGERAVSIKVDESNAVGHKIQPGDWVDVLVVFRKDGQEVPDTQARRLLQRKRILAYGALTEPARLPLLPKEKDKDSASSRADPIAEQLKAGYAARTAVLAVQVNEVNPLMLAERQGQVMLALRSPLEETTFDATPAAREPASPILLTAEASTGSPQVAQPSGLGHDVVTLERIAALGERKKPMAPPPVMPVKSVAPPIKQRVVSRPVVTQPGTAVELIRGTRTETVHY